MTKATLTLAHSGDPDDAFMWWPLTGKVDPDGVPLPGAEGAPRISHPRFAFRAVPGDIAQFNRLASAEAPYDVTALSVRAFAGVAERYVMTSCGSSFGEGYGPKVVCREDSPLRTPADLRGSDCPIAVPGHQTSAFMTLALLLKADAESAKNRCPEFAFDEVIPQVVGGRAGAGLVIHEGQITFGQAGLRQVVDLGAWWRRTRMLPLPLGINAVKADLDGRFGPGSLAEVAALLRASLAYALAHRQESTAYTVPFARRNAARSGTAELTPEGLDRYLNMYVTGLTQDLGAVGRRAIERFLAEGASAGLCPAVGVLKVV
ncbi:MAG: ABC transporter substrate-binding protein [Phycisphaerales bacterium]|nr:ABC transporter substrate-binding protein [Phycisphaerales bacterium]